MPPITIYTDGSNLEKNPGPGGWGAIIIGTKNGKPLHKHISGFVPDPTTTNNQMELTAILKALLEIRNPEIAEVIVHSDSQWAINAVSNPTWTIKKNVELVNEIKNLIKKFKSVEFQWIKGHCKNIHNETADSLAKLATKHKEPHRREYIDSFSFDPNLPQ